MAKQKQDTFLRNIVIGFGAIMVILVVGVLILNAVGPASDYSDFDYIDSYQKISTQSEDAYFVYFYSEECGACNSIKKTMIEFSDDNELGLKVYMLDAYATSGDRSLITGPGGVAMNSTPTLLLFDNGNMVEFIVNADNISDFVTSVENGSYILD